VQWWGRWVITVQVTDTTGVLQVCWPFVLSRDRCTARWRWHECIAISGIRRNRSLDFHPEDCLVVVLISQSSVFVPASNVISPQYCYDDSYAALPRGPHYVLHLVRPSVRPSVPCLRFSRNRKAVETSSLVKQIALEKGNQESKFEIWRSNVKVTGNKNVLIVFGT